MHTLNTSFLSKLKSPLVLAGVLCAFALYLLPSSCSPESSLTRVPRLPEKVDFNLHVKPILSDRCFNCHGPDAGSRQAGLRLDTEEGAFAALGEDENHYAIIPGDSENSTLVQRIYSEDPNDIMPTPESNLSLSDFEKSLLKKWVEQGAEWKKHWSFLPIEKPEVPTLEDFTGNAVDYFVEAERRRAGVQAQIPASREKLLRRVYFTLTGLPPSTEQVEAFIEKKEGIAYEEVVEELLKSDAYAEHMTSYWLDLARYADSHGYQDDLERIMFPWRDWVIHAFKKNLPYDDFVTWQLAGDLLPNPTKEQIIATAFNRNHKITQEGGVIPEEYRVEYVSDRTQTFGTAFLGLTFECAKCHDHKYDAISQKDYFSLFSFFNNVPEKGLIGYDEIPEPYITLSQEEIEATLTFINNADTLPEIPLMVMGEMEEPRQAHILARGAYDKPTEPVQPDLPESILAFDDALPQNRLGLSQWLFDERNPLTARVTVNRLWQQCFGRGIVATPDDFGNQGTLPTHPELLDWLAAELMEKDWDLQHILKLILNSDTYKQSAKVTPELLEFDPENNLLARAPRQRMTAEMIRDNALAVSGLLNRTVGGPSVKPYQPEGLWEATIGGGGGSLSKYVQDEGDKNYRRSIYTFWKRTVPPPSMMTFDAASRDICNVKRQSTGTPMQALVLLNDPQIIEASRVLACTTLSTEKDPGKRIAKMFKALTSRDIQPEELSSLRTYLEEEKERFEQDEEAMRALLAIGVSTIAPELLSAETAAYTVVANAMFNLDEAISL